MTSEAAFSVLVSNTLDTLGYSQQMMKYRQFTWGQLRKPPDRDSVTTGSKAEGLTHLLESDNDWMGASYDIVSTSTPWLYNHIESLTVFQMDRTNVAPGYTKLVHVKTGTVLRRYPSEVLPIELKHGNRYLCSDRFREKCRQCCTLFYWMLGTCYPKVNVLNLQQQSTHGPSNPMSSSIIFDAEFDQVNAIICDCPDILQSWINRPRRYQWPSAAVINEVSSLEAHVVPVGFKGSVWQFLEWRICFTKAEIKLIHSLNNCQIKLLVLLKMICKSSLKPICKDMTTYVMKNIVLWIAEIYPAELFTQENLFAALKLALRLLRRCLVARHLPSYMIPERNLLANTLATRKRLKLTARTRLCTMLDILLAEGTQMLLRCERLRNAWHMLLASPHTFRLVSAINIQCEIDTMSLIKQLSNEGYVAQITTTKTVFDMLSDLIADSIQRGHFKNFKELISRMLFFIK